MIEKAEEAQIDYALLEMKPFEFEAFAEVNEKYIKGEKFINVSPTALLI
jgi:hypothetical protein